MKNILPNTKERIKAICDAFASGDIDYILENFPEKFTMHDPADPFIVPYGGTFKGKSGIAEYFNLLRSNTNMTLWEVDEYIAEENKVVVSGKYAFLSTRTGDHVTSDWIMLFHFENEEPVSAKIYYNTSDIEKAFS